MKTTPERVNTVFLKPMITMFARPSHIDDDLAVLSQYSDELTAFKEAVLERAWVKIRRTWLRHTWPPLAKVIEACNESAKEQAVFVPPEPVSDKICDAVMFSDVGQKAIREGYGAQIVDFIDQAGRCPTDTEIARMKKTMVNHDLMLSGIRGKASALSDAICNIARAMEEREKKIAAKYKV